MRFMAGRTGRQGREAPTTCPGYNKPVLRLANSSAPAHARPHVGLAGAGCRTGRKWATLLPRMAEYPPPRFDALSTFYPALERLAFGRGLDRARTSYAEALRRARRILLVGEGNGRFLAWALRRSVPGPDATLVVLESSGRMLDRARRRCARLPAGGHVRFVQADARHWRSADGPFDLIVTHFVFDLYRPPAQRVLLQNLHAQAAPGASWVDVDFVADPGPIWHRSLMRLQYAFFRVATALEADRLYPVDAAFARLGWRLERCRRHLGGSVEARHWSLGKAR